MSHKSRAVTLYRRILRAARTWQGPAEEGEYIRTEAAASFRANRRLDAAAAQQALAEGESRLELGMHYKIPYPRLQHASQFKKRSFEVPALPRGR